MAGISLCAASLVAFAFQAWSGEVIRDHADGLGVVEALFGLVLSPPLENLLLVVLVEACAAARLTDRRLLPVLAAVPLAAWHGTFALSWGLVVYPAFVVYAHVYDHYRRLGHARTGYWASVLVHAIHNAAAMLLAIAF